MGLLLRASGPLRLATLMLTLMLLMMLRLTDSSSVWIMSGTNSSWRRSPLALLRRRWCGRLKMLLPPLARLTPMMLPLATLTLKSLRLETLMLQVM
jgi:hypothetical protein